MHNLQSPQPQRTIRARRSDSMDAIEHAYAQLEQQLAWLRDHQQIEEVTIAGAILDLIGGRALFSPFETTEQRSVPNRLALLWMWRAPMLDSTLFVSGPSRLEEIVQGEGSLGEPLSILKALERRREEPGPLERRFAALTGIEPGVITELWSLDEARVGGLILLVRARLRSPAGTQLVESLIERVSVRTDFGLMRSGSAVAAVTALAHVERARAQLLRCAAGAHGRLPDRDRLDQISRSCEEALELEPDNIEALLLRARASILGGTRGDLARARRDLDRVSVLDPDEGRVWCALGDLHRSQGHLKVAIQAFENALSAPKADPSAYFSRARVHLELGQLAKAELDARAYALMFLHKPAGHALLGKILRLRGDNAGAFDALEAGLQLDAEHPESLIERGSLYASLGHSDRALADFDRAVLVCGDGSAHYNRGNLRLVLGDLEGAESDFSDAANLSPGDLAPRLNRGTVRLMRGDEPGAAEDFEAAATEHPSSASARMKWGLLLLQLGRRSEGLVELRAALALAPDDWAPRADIERLALKPTSA